MKRRTRTQSNKKVEREQPRKDSDSKRINMDNERMSKFLKDIVGPYTKSEHGNDESWYALNDQLMKAAGQISFSNTTGAPLTLDGETNFHVPGVMRLDLKPVVGSYYDCDALNAAANQVYSYVVHANSRNTSYNASDLMVLIIAGMNVFALVDAAIRAYGVAKSYSQVNKYLPQGLLLAMGFDPDDIQANLNQMWYDINLLVAKTTQIWIPNTMPLMKRWHWLNTDVYMDAESVKAQYYVLGFRYFWQFSETGSSTGSALFHAGKNGKPMTIGDTDDAFSLGAGAKVKWADFMTVANGMISSLVDSEDRGVMMGDILKAYGTEKIFALNEIDTNYRIVPVYDRKVLSQIENATVAKVGSIFSYEQNQTTGRLEPSGVTVNGKTIKSIDLVPNYSILNFHTTESPTPGEVMVATRLKALGCRVTQTSGGVHVAPMTLGTEVCLGTYVVEFNANGLSTVEVDTNNAANMSMSLIFNNWFNSAAFDWSPWIYTRANNVNYTVGTTDPSDIVPAGTYNGIGDYDYLTTIGIDQLSRMHNCAIYSLFDVPIF